MGSHAKQALKEFVLDKNLINDFSHITLFSHTRKLAAYNALLTKMLSNETRTLQLQGHGSKTAAVITGSQHEPPKKQVTNKEKESGFCQI